MNNELPELTEEEKAAAYIEAQYKKRAHLKALVNGITWDTSDPRFGRKVSTEKYKRPQQNDFKKTNNL